MKNAEKLVEPLRVACSLNDEEFAARRAMVRERLAPHIIDIERTDTGVSIAFSPETVKRSDVETFAALERQCCGFLDFELSPPDEKLTLTVTGPPDAAPALDALAQRGSIE